MAWTLLRRPRLIALAMTLTIQGYHFRKINRNGTCSMLCPNAPAATPDGRPAPLPPAEGPACRGKGPVVIGQPSRPAPAAGVRRAP